MPEVKRNIDTKNVLTANDASTKIDAIKQLIFGENMEAYDSEFESVKKNLLNTKNELENLIDEVRSELIQSIDNLSTDVNIRVTELEDQLNNKMDILETKKVDRKLLGELLTQLGEKISQ